LKQKVKGPAAFKFFVFCNAKINYDRRKLVDKDDQQIGLMPKLEAHEKRFASFFSFFCFEQQE
jgi:hypothetical protein